MPDSSSLLREPPLLSVIIVAYNCDRQTRRCLAHLALQTTKMPFSVLLFDNASEDHGNNDYPAYPFPLRIVTSRKNRGFARANNIAARLCKTKWVALLNPDAYAAPNWLEQLAVGWTTYPEDQYFGCIQIDALQTSRLDGCGDCYALGGIMYRGGFRYRIDAAPKKDGRIFSACGAAMLVERRFFLRHGGFDGRYFCYGEDVDFGFRMLLSARRCILLHRAIVYHETSSISSRYPGFAAYHGMRNLVWTFIKNMPWPLLLLHAPFFAGALVIYGLRSLRRRQGRAYLRGILDALRGMRPILRSRRRIQALRCNKLCTIESNMIHDPRKIMRRAPYIQPI